MKNHYLLTATLLLTGLFANAQPCTIDPSFQDSVPGIYGNLPTAYSNQDYSGVLFVVTDTANSFIPNAYYVTYSKLASVYNLPEGFTYTANYNNTDNWTNNGAFPDWDPLVSCFIITAPAQAISNALGLYTEISIPLTIKIDECVSDDLSASPCYWTSMYNVYKTYERTLYLSAVTGISETGSSVFSVGNSYPNPANGQTFIPFNTPKAETVILKMYNPLGMLVHQSTVQSISGKNQFTVNTSTLASGLYSYTVTNGRQSITSKLIVE